ncbi:phosphate ABC transporter permease subunit PstC [Candidatus Methylacidithermus pantelleriae]|uniref:Phosphate transport system permease protein n=1 Tax=Candidatus Methylacidithermus pantelleriae TaxID=2744239 RepID=A0A8J2BRW0_9BACT|nr:phosphate ABC transporter permease subunit PstC [Candidatus Methylacidithermus pantelleriae]CAF0702619.1 Phosphate ABC transporter, permease protein [Candidatus Methylacidithermus pantelleriae]
MYGLLGGLPKARVHRIGDRAFRFLCMIAAFSVFLLIVLVGWEVYLQSRVAIERFGIRFIWKSEWDPVREDFGALPFIYGTLVTSLLALVLAFPVSVGTAIYLTELAPVWLRQPVASLIEMIAAVPSVIWGLWGLFAFVPWLRDYVYPVLKKTFGFLPFFSGSSYGPSLLAASLIVAIMILPIISAVAREVLRSVPDLQREAAYALGATGWEVTRIAVLSYAKRGLIGAAILGLGRALGETMAVTMVVGNRPEIVLSLLSPGYTLASVIANEFTEATTTTYLSALFELGLILLGLTVVVNVLAQILIETVKGSE